MLSRVSTLPASDGQVIRPYASPTISAAYFAPSAACFATVVATRFTRPAALPATRFALATRPAGRRRRRVVFRAEDFLALLRADDFRADDRLAPPRFRAEDFLAELLRADDFFLPREERFDPARLDPFILDPLRFLRDRFVAMLKSPKWGVVSERVASFAHTQAVCAAGWVRARTSLRCGRDSVLRARHRPRPACGS